MPVLTANQRDEADQTENAPRQGIQACHQNQRHDQDPCREQYDLEDSHWQDSNF